MTKFCIYLSDGFPILSLTLITEPLRVANRELGRHKFKWQIVSEAGDVCTSSSGIPMQTDPLPAKAPDAVVLLASYKPERSATEVTLSWLRNMDRQGALMGCVDTGALVFAKAGLLGMRPAAVHPEAMSGFHRQFPDSLFVDRLWDMSPPRVSSAGGVSTLDMTLALIGHFANSRTARRVGDILTYSQQTSPALPDVPGSIPATVRNAVSVMDAHLADPLPISEVARRLDLTTWKLNRMFRKYLHHTPTSYYVRRRLMRGRDMLRNTTLMVGDIASDCGYDNAEVFSRAYRSRFGVAPSRDRSF